MIPLTDSNRLKRTVTALVIVTIFAPFIYFGVVASDLHFAWVMQDDAFYYSETARNFVELGWATFDTLNPTNGFHPLYFLLVSGIAWLSNDDFYLNGIYLLHWAILLIAFWKISRIVEPAPVWAILLVLALTASTPWLRNVSQNAGMESTLAFASAIFFYEAFRKAAEAGFSKLNRNLAFGTAATVLMLSRLDTIIVVMPVAITAAAWAMSVNSLRRVPVICVSLFAIPLVCCSAYLAINILTTGHLSPVSGAAKWAFRMPWEVSFMTITSGYKPRAVLTFLLPLLMSAVAVFVAIRKIGNREFHLAATMILAAVGINLYYLYLRFGASNAFNWYMAAVTGSSTWILATLIAGIRGPRVPRVTAIILLTLSFFLVAVVFARNLNSSNAVIERVDLQGRTHKLADLGRLLGSIAGPGDIAATFDAGKIGYFSPLPVINLDGLANSYRYLEEVRSKGRFKEYFDEMGVTYFLARGSTLSNTEAVLDGTYKSTAFLYDPRLVFSSEDELHRDVVDEGFLVVVFQYPPASMNE